MEIEVTVPDGQKGEWQIETFNVSKEEADFDRLRCMVKGHGYRHVKPGTYKRLKHNGETIMSNTRAEINDHLEFINMAERYGGDILINGLGLGVALTKILEFTNVNSVTVIEIDWDVITLVAPHFEDDRVKVIHANALEYKPPTGKTYTAVWHDIWPTICSDNLPEMATLHRKYGRRCAWQGSWAKHECLVERKKAEQGIWW